MCFNKLLYGPICKKVTLCFIEVSDFIVLKTIDTPLRKGKYEIDSHLMRHIFIQLNYSIDSKESHVQKAANWRPS